MTKKELNLLSRDELISQAEGLGVNDPRVLSQPELIDEILLRTVDSPSERRATRGWFGRARDLLKTVIDRGLHLPEAAARVTKRPSVAPGAGMREPYPTVTLAEIYVGQGHQSRAREVLGQVLEREPGHTGARAMLDGLERERSKAAREAASNVDAPAAALSNDAKSANASASDSGAEADDGELPTRYDVDEVVAIAVDPTTVYAYWEVRPATMAEAKHRHTRGRLVLRAVTVTPSHPGPISEERDITIDALCGDIYLSELDAGTNVRVSVGWRWGSASDADAFEPFAVGLELSTPRASPEMLASSAPTKNVKRTPVVRLGGPAGIGSPPTAPDTAGPAMPAHVSLAASAAPLGGMPAGAAGSNWTRTVLWRGGAGQTLAVSEELEHWVLEHAGASDLVRRRARSLHITGASDLARLDLTRTGASDLARLGASQLSRSRPATTG